MTLASSIANAYTYTEHFVVTPNDPGVHVYFAANHATSDIAGSIGQVQWVLRGDLNKFPNTYSVNADLSNPGPTAIPLPSAERRSRRTRKGGAGRDGGSGWVYGYSGGIYALVLTKYDYSSYEYLHRAHGVYGSKYGAWVVLPSSESLVGGSTKQDLIFTGNLAMMEAYSNHLDNQLALATPAGTASQRLFGPFYYRFNQFGGSILTPADMYQDALVTGTSFGNFYDHEADLLSNGYVPSTARGTVQVQINNVMGNRKTAWAVLSAPGKIIQCSAGGAQYWADISSSGNATFTGVIPGTYRLSAYVLGQWGELRQDGVVVAANQVTTVPGLTFAKENFSDVAPVFTIGTADRCRKSFCTATMRRDTTTVSSGGRGTTGPTSRRMAAQ